MKKCGRPKGSKQSLETRRKISLGNMGKVMSEEAREKIRKGLIGNKNALGRKWSIEERLKHSKIENSGAFKKGQTSPRKGKKYPQYSGVNSSQWKGGITSLHDAIRLSIENKEWKIKVFQRDGHTCQDCGSSKSNTLEAHHLKRFSLILGEFLQTYSQFSPIEDRETLIRLAFTYKPFWNIDNGKTLCIDCHNLTRGRLIKGETK